MLKKTEISYFFWKIKIVGKLLIFEDIDFRFFYCDISAIGTPDFQWFEVEKVN